MTRQVDINALVSHIVKGDGMDKCRICMGDTSQGQVHLGDTVMMDGDKPVTLSELLETITGVQMETSPVMPDLLCMSCTSPVKKFIPFLKLCLESMKKWHKIIESIALFKISQKITTAYILVKPNEVEVVTDRSTKQKTGKEILKNIMQKLAIRHSRNTNEHTKKIVQKRILNIRKNKICSECGYTHSSPYTLNVHLKHCRKMYCSYCKIIINRNQYGIHLKKYHNIKSFLCPVCSISFKNREKLVKHKLRHENYKHSCLECKLPFETVDKLTAHLKKSHKTVSCKKCNKTFSNRYCFKFHTKSCTKPYEKKSQIEIKHFICDLCKNEFKTRTGIQTHMLKVHLNMFTFTCENCGKQFMSDSALEEHKESHDKISNRYVCQFCGSKYSTSGGHRKHMRIKHYRVNPELYKKTVYPCTECQKVLSSQKYLEKHLVVKHGIKST